MKLAEIRKSIAGHMGAFLAESGFKVDKFHLSGIDLKYEDDEIIAASGYQLYRGGGWYSFTPTGIVIGFKNIEKIMFELSVRHGLWREHYSEPPTKPGFTFGSYHDSQKGHAIVSECRDIRIASEEDVIKFSGLAKKYFAEFLFPWFKKYSLLKSVNEFVNSVDDFTSGNSFCGFHMMRKIIVKRFCNDPGYETYLEFWIDRFTNAQDLENGRYIPYLNACLDLKRILK